MELPESRVNSAVARRLWNLLRVSFFMIRKGIMSKRKLIMDMNMMMKRGKLMRKTLTNLLFHHHHHHHHHHHSKAMARGGSAIREYEFSCSNSPNPVFFRMPTRNKHHFFPCINPPQVIEEEEDQEDDREEEANKAVALMPKTPEYDFSFHFGTPGERINKEDEKPSPLLLSPFAVRVSNYSSEDEDEGGNCCGRVDDEAEEFIRRFHEQLRKQTRMQLLQY